MIPVDRARRDQDNKNIIIDWDEIVLLFHRAKFGIDVKYDILRHTIIICAIFSLSK